jgi:dephospho-CoA kinase
MRKTSGQLLLVGVTGGIGTGKSEVCRVFESLDVPVLYADEISKELSIANPVVRRKILALFGEDAYLTDGSLNRLWVAEKIFSQKSLQQRLEKILHPTVFKEIEARATTLQAQGSRIAIVEAALVFEAKLDRLLDAVIVVDAAESHRLERLQQRDHVTIESIRKRMRAQGSQAQKLARADFVIYNNGTPEELRERVVFLHKILLNVSHN